MYVYSIFIEGAAATAGAEVGREDVGVLSTGNTSTCVADNVKFCDWLSKGTTFVRSLQHQPWKRFPIRRTQSTHPTTSRYTPRIPHAILELRAGETCLVTAIPTSFTSTSV